MPSNQEFLIPQLLLLAQRGAYGPPFSSAQGVEHAGGSRVGHELFVDGHDHRVGAVGAGRYKLGVAREL